ncbi:Fatty-acid-binding protein 3, chloroplastic [Zea mays]|uniref:Fatty-acid-binding protein 3, chloroplastic n=1 Tax=Zea mays TaxID=4577 RepID=A0A3L6EVS8_MAIZE|nr:Fatty-acid-binding protein 3, chloroplastic [Zea mays]
MNLASVVPCGQAFTVLMTPAAGSHRRVHTHAAASKSGLACRVARSGGARWLPVSCAAGGGADYSLRLDTEQWKAKTGIESFDSSSVFDSIFKAPVVKSLSIILVRAVDGKTFVNALNDVIARQIKNPNAEEESSLSTLQNTFLGRNLKQGTSIYLTWLEPKRMLIISQCAAFRGNEANAVTSNIENSGIQTVKMAVEGISISEDEDPRQVDAEIKSATVNYALYDGFFGKSTVCPSLRSSTAQLLDALLLAK